MTNIRVKNQAHVEALYDLYAKDKEPSDFGNIFFLCNPAMFKKESTAIPIGGCLDFSGKFDRATRIKICFSHANFPDSICFRILENEESTTCMSVSSFYATNNTGAEYRKHPHEDAWKLFLKTHNRVWETIGLNGEGGNLTLELSEGMQMLTNWLRWFKNYGS